VNAAPAPMFAAPANVSSRDSWLLDTGTGCDLCPLSQPQGQRQLRKDLPIMSTAGGEVEADVSVVVGLEVLEEDSECIGLPCTPHALSVGRRCAQFGYKFQWDPFASVPVMTRPDGSLVQGIRVEHYVPVLDMDTAPAAGRDRLIPCAPAQMLMDSSPLPQGEGQSEQSSPVPKGPGESPGGSELPEIVRVLEGGRVPNDEGVDGGAEE
jgi:hypothetical protein